MAETSYIIQNGKRLNLKDAAARSSIGSCDELKTEAQHCLVHAINELAEKIDKGFVINKDYDDDSTGIRVNNADVIVSTGDVLVENGGVAVGDLFFNSTSMNSDGIKIETDEGKITLSLREGLCFEDVEGNVKRLGGIDYISEQPDPNGAVMFSEMEEYVEENGRAPIVDAESEDGVTYTASVPSVTALYSGLKIIVVPNTTSTDRQSTTLNVNGLGAKRVFYQSNSTGGKLIPTKDDFLTANAPTEMMYFADGGYWVINITRPAVNELYGTVQVKNGGTGRSTLTSGHFLVGNGTAAVELKSETDVIKDLAAKVIASGLVATVPNGGTGRSILTSGYYLVGNGIGSVTLKSKAQVLSDIGAVSLETYNALLARFEELESTVNDICNQLGIA